MISARSSSAVSARDRLRCRRVDCLPGLAALEPRGRRPWRGLEPADHGRRSRRLSVVPWPRWCTMTIGQAKHIVTDTIFGLQGLNIVSRRIALTAGRNWVSTRAGPANLRWHLRTPRNETRFRTHPAWLNGFLSELASRPSHSSGQVGAGLSGSYSGSPRASPGDGSPGPGHFVHPSD